MRENNLLDFNMYEATLSQNVRQPDGAYAERTYSDNSGGGSATFTKVHTFTLSRTYYNGQTIEYADPLYVYNNDSDVLEISENNLSDGIFVILNPIKKLSIGTLGSSPHIIFTPAKDYDGIYSLSSGNMFHFTGDPVVANDGKTYSAYVNFSGSSYSIKRFNKEFSSEVE